MSKEIAFEPKTLWAGVVGAVIGGAWAVAQPEDGSMPGWAFVLGFAGIGFVAFLYLAMIFLEPLAKFKNAVYAEGVARDKASSDMFSEYRWLIVGGVLGTVLALTGLWDAWRDSTQSFLHRHPTLATALFVFWVLLMFIGSSGVLKRRRERNSLNTIDLSKSRDLSLK